MPGRIMTAQQAAKTHKGRGITKKGNKVSLKNSDGRRVTVGKNDKVYHRGKGKFGRYSTKADAKRVSRGATNLSKPEHPAYICNKDQILKIGDKIKNRYGDIFKVVSAKYDDYFKYQRIEFSKVMKNGRVCKTKFTGVGSEYQRIEV